MSVDSLYSGDARTGGASKDKAHPEFWGGRRAGSQSLVVRQ
jgi:hypothetical protein